MPIERTLPRETTGDYTGAPTLVIGNTAKLYCMDLLVADIDRAGFHAPYRIVDLGCGTGTQFAELLRRRPNVKYVGVEPDRRACAVARRELGDRAEIVNAPAYDVDVGAADVVVSFSVLEHVYRRRDYLMCVARHVAPGGMALVNYDAGHFVGPGSLRRRGREHAKTIVGRILAPFGNESKFQRFVPEAEFLGFVRDAGLTVVDDRMFNTDLKRAWTVAGDPSPQLMRQWLELELAIGERVHYRDELASIFMTRNFVLRHATAA
jgi:SAM-dependent methyltransferase